MKVPASELKVGDIIDGERRVVRVEKYLGAKLRVTFDYVSGSRKGERAAYVEKGDKLVSVEREAEENMSIQDRMTRLLAETQTSTIYLRHHTGANHAFKGRKLAALVKAVKANAAQPILTDLVLAGYEGWLAPSGHVEDLESLPDAIMAGKY